MSIQCLFYAIETKGWLALYKRDPVPRDKLYTDFCTVVHEFHVAILPSTLVILVVSWPFIDAVIRPLEFARLCEYIFDALLFLAVYNVVFYWAHRGMHLPGVYEHVHKKHHQNTSPMSAIHTDHATVHEVVFGVVVVHTVSMGIMCSVWYLAGGMPVQVAWLKLVFDLAQSISSHSGYSFVPGERHHSLHHTRARSNYAMPWVDWLFGTYET